MAEEIKSLQNYETDNRKGNKGQNDNKQNFKGAHKYKSPC